MVLKEILAMIMNDPNYELEFFRGLKREERPLDAIIKRIEEEEQKQNSRPARAGSDSADGGGSVEG